MALLIAVCSVQAATIYGEVYDFGLDLGINAVVDINTTPRQQIVAKDGSYSFTVTAGEYSLKARLNDYFIAETLSVPDEGSFELDLILLPDFEEDVFKDDFLIDEPLSERPIYHWILWVFVFLLLAYIVYLVSKKKEVIKEVKEIVHKEVAVHEDLDSILAFIEKEGGRTTQKDIRREFPHSEAKISLMLAELESKGLIERIKKGRGNIIVKK